MSKIEDAVIAKINARAAAGLAKYGVTVERTDLTRLQWLQHAQDEAMDLAIYLQRLIADESSERREAPAEERIDWAAIPWAMWVCADDEGIACATNSKRAPIADEHRCGWNGSPLGSRWEQIDATIPGPWTQSLRKRPEGV